MAGTHSDYTRRVERLLEVCRNLSANLDFQPLLHSIIEVASELTLSESSSILIYDKDNNYLRFLAAPWYMMERLQSMGIPLDRSVAGWVYTNQQAMALHHTDKDNRISRMVDREITEKTNSLMAVPLIFKGKTIGVLETLNKANDQHFTEDDVMVLETLASQAAVVIQNHILLEETQQAFQKMMELDRMKTDFIAITSHELRTPLGLVLGHTTILLEDCREEDRHNLEVVQQNATRLREIVEQFSDVERMRQGMTSLHRTRVSIPGIVREVMDSFQSIAKQHEISLTSELPSGPLSVDGDAEKVAIALRNLVQNAITFTNPGGKVKVKAEQVPGYIKVSVMDNGIGIPQEEQGRIFERFYQVEKHMTRKHGGMGLGLSIAREMIEMHGGKIWVESVESKGSKFMFFLPQNAAQASAAKSVFTA
jgi:signal transduction histidine kinase